MRIGFSRPSVTAFKEIIVVPVFPADHPLGDADLPRGQKVVSYEFGLNAARRLATAQTCLDDALDSYLSSLSFYHDVPVEAVAWRVTEERTGAVHFAMKLLGKVKQLDLPRTLLRSTPSRRELFSTWREAMNAPTPMFQALGYYKLIERIHKYR